MLSRVRRGMLLAGLTAAVFGSWIVEVAAGPTMDAIKRAGVLSCGVSTGVAGWSQPDSQGRWTGFDVDMCRAIAAAVLGDASKVKFVPLSAQQRFTALQTGEIDVLSSRATWSLIRDASLGINFLTISFYDGQGFLVPKKLNLKSAKELAGASICVQPGTTSELNLADYMRSNNLNARTVVIEDRDAVEQAYFSGRCDSFSTDATSLAATRAAKAASADDHVILPDRISKEPLAQAVRHGDDEFFDIAKWSIYALINAEEKGVTSANVDEMLKNEDPEIKRLLGTTPGMGKALGLDEQWAYRIIKQVGNYGDIFERNVGINTPLHLERGQNALWTQGGLIYAPPIR
ncbi:MAG: amino acid ABC transporter substrate-binding protein [Proteobacteria bacterium]|nr:amino acid ABC transporter substrate-binding protein [Pseudomonadota bacterium]